MRDYKTSSSRIRRCQDFKDFKRKCEHITQGNEYMHGGKWYEETENDGIIRDFFLRRQRQVEARGTRNLKHPIILHWLD